MTLSQHADEVRLKDQVQEFWQAASCGERYAQGDDLRLRLEAQEKIRYDLEPYIYDFAQFHEARDRDVLEIGVGMGADHLQWARAQPRSLEGVDLTERAIAFTGARLRLYGLISELRQADAEHLPFPDSTFDIVYSWGVLHHTPDTQGAIREVFRVLRPGGVARVMMYNRRSLIGYLLYLRYALLRGRPRTSLHALFATYMESPGTKAYTPREAAGLFARFSDTHVRTQINFGDLLLGEVGDRHRGRLLSAARRVWPRTLIRRFGTPFGFYLLIEAHK